MSTMNLVSNASDSTLLDLDSLPHTYTYTGTNRLTDAVAHPNGHTYTQSYTYDGSNNKLTQSAWVKTS